MSIKDDKNFGFKKVSSKKKRTLVDEVFSAVAGKYDLMNDLMSFGIHRLWKNELCKMIPNLNSVILDVAGGTGDIAFRIKEKARYQRKEAHVVVCDINKEMLKICKNRAIDKNILNKLDLAVGDAEKLPFLNDSFDYYIIAFGIRNMICVEKTLEEAYRVLKPTGKFLCLEFSKVRNDFIRLFYDFYSSNVIPSIAGCVANNQDAYKYLTESIRLFPGQEDFKTMIQEVGFSDVNYKNLSFGIATIHCGFKV